MKAMITDIVKKNQTTYVLFSCPCGEGIGVWRSPAAPQKRSYDVELDFECRIEANMIVRGALVVPGLARTGEETAVRAKIDSVDDDGMTYLRLHDSCLVMTESGLTTAERASSAAFTLGRDQLVLTPFEL